MNQSAAMFFLQAALNGARPPAQHPGIPVSAADLAVAARDAVAAGAHALHVHVRDADGVESLAAADVAAVLRAARRACPGIAVGVSTGIWIVPEPAARRQAVAAWTDLPDYASVNFEEPGAAELARDLLARGVGIEAGLDGPGTVEHLLECGVGPRCLRLLLEPQDRTVPDALQTVASIEAALRGTGLTGPRLLHGVNATAWPLLAEAARRGHGARIGFEDVVHLPDGRPARTNADLVRAAAPLLATGTPATAAPNTAQRS